MGPAFLGLVFACTAGITALVLMPGEPTAVARKRLRALRRDTAPADALERQELAEPFTRRVLWPAWQRLAHAVWRHTPAGYRDRLRARLRQAGDPMSPAAFLLAKAAAVGSAGLAWLAGAGGVAGLACLALAWWSPDLWLARRAAARRDEIARSLPDVIDLLCVSVEAGIGFDGAVQKVSEKFGGATGAEFTQYLKEVRLGRSREEALRALVERVPLPELRSFAAAVIQAERLGVSLARVLRVQARQLRQRRRQRAEEHAMRVPVKLVFPLVFFIFPSLLAILLGPALIRILTVLGTP